MNHDTIEKPTVDSVQEVFRDAVRAGEMDIVSDIVLKEKENGNASFQAIMDSRDDLSGNTALHFSSANGHIDILNFLVQNGATVDAKNTSGSTALHYAAMTGQLEAVETLLRGGASPIIENDFGRTALDEAQSARRTNVVKFLIQHVESNAIIQDLDEEET